MKPVMGSCFWPGMQHGVIMAGEPFGLGLNETLLPQHLKEQGYATHAIGKVLQLVLSVLFVRHMLNQG